MKEDFNRKNLELRAASYYKSIRLPKNMWLIIDDLAPQILEFEHYINAEDFDKAALILNEIDYDYLTLWGFGAMVIEMRKKIHGKILDNYIKGRHLSYYGYANLAVSKYFNALQLSNEALSIFEESIHISDKIFTLGNLGRIYHQKGEFKKSQIYYKQAIEIARTNKKNELLSVFLANLAISQYMDGNFDNTLQYSMEAVELAESDRDRARALSSLGLAYQALKEYKKSEKALYESLCLAIVLDDFKSQAFRYGHLGKLFSEQGEYIKALEFENKGYLAAEKADSKELMSFRMLGMGRINNLLHTYDDAERLLKRSIEISYEIKNWMCYTESVLTLLQCYLYKNDLLRAEKILDKIKEENSLTKFFRALVNARLGNFKVAKNLFNDAFEYSKNEFSIDRNNFNDQYIQSLIFLGLSLFVDKNQEKELLEKTFLYLNKAKSYNNEIGIIEYYLAIINEFSKINNIKQTSILLFIDKMLQ